MNVTHAIGVWLLLLALLLITCASAWIPMGAWNTVINLAIAAAKALLVAIFFMHLRRSRPVLRIAAATGLLFVALLLGLSLTDYAVRETFEAPWQVPAAGRP